MAELFAHVTHWHWWVVAVLLVVIEVLVPGTFFLWLGVAAGAVGLVVLLLPALGWEYQVLLFAIVTVGSTVAGRQWLKRAPTDSDQPLLNRRGEQYVGRTFTLIEPVVNGYGKIRVDDTTWKTRGEEMPAGAQVRVTGVEGTVLTIERVAPGERP